MRCDEHLRQSHVVDVDDGGEIAFGAELGQIRRMIWREVFGSSEAVGSSTRSSFGS